MGRSVNLNLILVIVFIFIGFAWGGVMGGLIAAPIADVVGILLRHLVIEPCKEGAAPRIVERGILLPGTVDLEDSTTELPNVSEGTWH